MPDNAMAFRGWKRHILRRELRTRTTWRFRAIVAVIAALTLWLTSGWWPRAIGEGLVCASGLQSADALLIENFDPEYLLFERARELRRQGVATRVLVPVRLDPGTSHPNSIAVGIADLMARTSAIGPLELVSIREVEPISLNAAMDIRSYLQRHGIRSVVLVTSLFRSRRSALVYEAVLERSGIRVHCDAGDRRERIENWPGTWHGVQNVTEQWVKLLYYRLYVLTSHAHATSQ